MTRPKTLRELLKEKDVFLDTFDLSRIEVAVKIWLQGKLMAGNEKAQVNNEIILRLIKEVES